MRTFRNEQLKSCIWRGIYIKDPRSVLLCARDGNPERQGGEDDGSSSE